MLKKLVKDGFDEKALFAGINYYEFKYREADFGSYPKGTYVRFTGAGQLAVR